MEGIWRHTLSAALGMYIKQVVSAPARRHDHLVLRRTAHAVRAPKLSELVVNQIWMYNQISMNHNEWLL